MVYLKQIFYLRTLQGDQFSSTDINSQIGTLYACLIQFMASGDVLFSTQLDNIQLNTQLNHMF